MCYFKRLLLSSIVAAMLGWTLLGTVAAQSQRPVVVIPGILGSVLADDKGEVVWGDRRSLQNFGRLDFDPAGNGSTLHPIGLVEQIRVLGPFWTVHAYEDLLVHLRSLGFRDGETLFVFSYDWRQSNFHTAKLFDAWVKERPALTNSQFDIVAHSMGGIVTRIWMLEHGGSSRVRKAIYLGTPFQGSMNALATLSEGWGDFKNHIAGGIDLVRRTMLSFPAAYELFPSYTRCCRLGDPRSHTFLNIFDPIQWNAQGWLPPEYRDGGSRADVFRAGLQHAARVADLMARPLPGVEEVRIAGDNQETRLYLYAKRAEHGWRAWSFTSSRGDGTVPVWSAGNAREGNLAGTLPAFVEHATIFRDEWVKEVLRRELIITAPPQVNALAPEILTRAGTHQRLDTVDVRLEPPVVPPEAPTRLIVTLRFPADAQIGRGEALGLTAQLAAPGAVPIALIETTDDASLSQKILTFAAELRAPAEEEVYRIDINLPALGQRAAYLTVEKQP